MENTYVKEINFLELIKCIVKKVSRIIVIGIITSLLAAGLKYLVSGKSMGQEIEVTYQPKSDYLGNTIIFLGSNSTLATIDVAKTYINGVEMHESIISDLNLEISKTELIGMINLNRSTDNLLIIDVAGQDEKLVRQITEYLSISGSEKLRDKLSKPDIMVLEPANTYLRQYNIEVKHEVFSTRKLLMGLMKYAAIGFFLGVLMSVIVIIILFMINNTIKNEMDIAGYLNIPVLGTISIAEGAKKIVENDKKRLKGRMYQYKNK